MGMNLCEGCGRHVRESDQRCPFCGGDARPVVVARKPTPRVSRAVLIAGVGAAAVGVACNQTVATFYGAPFDASGVDVSDAAQFDAVPLYGGPPLEAGIFDASDAASDADDAGD